MSDVGTNPLTTYNKTLDREGYFCDICGMEAGNRNGIRLYQHTHSDDVLRVCIRRCLSDD